MRLRSLLCLVAAGTLAFSTQPAHADERTSYRLSFASFGPLDTDVFIADADGRNATPGNDAHSAWSRDGRWLAFSSSRGGFKDEGILYQANPQSYGELYVMRADGSDARALTDNQFEEATPAWIPDGAAVSTR